MQLFQQGFPQKLWKSRDLRIKNLWKTLWKLCKTLQIKGRFFINSHFACGKVDFSWFEKLFVENCFFSVFNKKHLFSKKVLTRFFASQQVSPCIFAHTLQSPSPRRIRSEQKHFCAVSFFIIIANKALPRKIPTPLSDKHPKFIISSVLFNNFVTLVLLIVTKKCFIIINNIDNVQKLVYNIRK